MLINRNVTRTVKNSTETTKETSTPATSALSFALTTTDKFYVGFKEKFAARYFHLSVANTNACTLTVKYWDGSAFSAVQDLVDQTIGFTTSGFISWQNQTDWALKALTPITDVELYWIEITVSTNLSATTAMQAVLNLFCDDAMVRQYYPELITDTRWLPSSRTDYLEQYVAAKDLIVQRLKQKGAIKDESQILDLNEVAIPATHAAAFIIMFPVLSGEEERARAKDAEAEMNKALDMIRMDLDQDNSGIIEEDEEESGQTFRLRGNVGNLP